MGSRVRFPKDLRFRDIAFTVFNWSPEDKNKILNHPYFNYCIIGEEICPKTGESHLQGYGEFKKKYHLNTIKKDIHPTVHVEERFASQIANIDYCKKNNIWVEHGEQKHQGRRVDLHDLYTFAQQGLKLSDIVKEHELTLRQQKTYLFTKNHFDKTRPKEKPEVLCFHGDTGTGKTERAFSYPDVYEKPHDKWWDDYEQKETIVLDDIEYNTFAFRTLLRLLGRHTFLGETKGGKLYINRKRIIITADESPQEMFSHMPKRKLDQLMRRIDHIELFESNYQKLGNTTPASM